MLVGLDSLYLKNSIFISFAEAPCNDDFPECMRVCFLATTDWTKEDCKEECCKGGPLVKKKGKANINLLKQGYLPVSNLINPWLLEFDTYYTQS